MTFAYADPPYLGCAKLYKKHHPNALKWDELSTHRSLIDSLVNDYPDGWAMSLSSTSLSTLLPLCPPDCRVSAWVKPFAAFKPNVGVAYAWEPVIWRGGRPRTRQQPTVRDWVSANITMRKGLPGAKPSAFCWWLLELLNVEMGDSVIDLFPGTNSLSRAWEGWQYWNRGMLDEVDF